MTTYHVVTTCNEAGWQKYGRRMVKTFLYYWPAATRFTLYAEGFVPEQPVPLCMLPPWLIDFKERHRANPRHNGLGHVKPYDMLYDAVRFSHKVGAVIDAANHTDADVLIWMDADVVTHSRVSTDFLDTLLPEGAALAWLDRKHKYPECGFYMLRLDHACMPQLLATWQRLYTGDHLFELQHWTDCHSLQAAVERTSAPTASLSGGYTYLGHPFINGPLGTVMDHLKGERKSNGKSRRMDLRLRRPEPYWRGIR